MCIHACMYVSVCVCFLRPNRGGKFSRAIIRPQITALHSQKSPLLGPHQQHSEDSTPKPKRIHSGKMSQPQSHRNRFSRKHTGPSSKLFFVGKYFSDEQKHGLFNDSNSLSLSLSSICMCRQCRLFSLSS